MTRVGPLSGVSVVELAGMPPVSFAARLLADQGATVTRVCRPEDRTRGLAQGLFRHRHRTVVADLKSPSGHQTARDLVAGADVLLEGFRPGVTERLGLGPSDCARINPRLIYARLTGWGQSGPYADRPGHDINYIGLAGILEPLGEADRPPTVPLTLLGNFAGGGLTLVVGILAALYERVTTGTGVVIDGAILDGAVQLGAGLHAARADGGWVDRRHANLIDGAAPFYRCYRTADDRFVAVGAVEPRAFTALLSLTGLPAELLERQHDRTAWDLIAQALADSFAARSRQDWVLDPRAAEACVTAVLAPAELAADPHIAARGLLSPRGDGFDVAAAPRLRPITDPHEAM